MNIRKAIIPVAGFGTRMLPASKSVPKSILPVFDTPAVHLIAKEAADAGIEHAIFIVSPGQGAITEYFNNIPELERALEQRDDSDNLCRMYSINNMIATSEIVQREQLGLGAAILEAKNVIGDEPFAVLLPDDIIMSSKPTIGEMANLFDNSGNTIIAVREAPKKQLTNLGVVEATQLEDRIYNIQSLVEKPPPCEAPSNLGIVGRYILTPQIFEELEKTEPGIGGEIQITDALSKLLSEETALAYKFPGVHFDVGTPFGLLQASVYSALQRSGVNVELRTWLSGMLK